MHVTILSPARLHLLTIVQVSSIIRAIARPSCHCASAQHSDPQVQTSIHPEHPRCLPGGPRQASLGPCLLLAPGGSIVRRIHIEGVPHYFFPPLPEFGFLEAFELSPISELRVLAALSSRSQSGSFE